MSEAMEYNPKAVKKRIGLKLHKLLWVAVNSTLFRYSPFFCYGWRRFLLRCFGAKIAKTATISRLARLENPWNLTMDERSMICNHTWIMCHGPIEIGEQSIIGEYARILTGSHVSNSRSYKCIVSGVTIGRNCWIASCAILSSGGYRTLKIGDGAVIGVGSVVTTNVKPMAIMMGNPARFIMMREFNKE